MIKVVEVAYMGHKEIDASLRMKFKEHLKDDSGCVAPGTRSKLDFMEVVVREVGWQIKCEEVSVVVLQR